MCYCYCVCVCVLLCVISVWMWLVVWYVIVWIVSDGFMLLMVGNIELLYIYRFGMFQLW